MEKEKPTTRSMSKILRFLPKAAQAAVSFQNPLFSPGRDKRPDLNSHNFKAHVSKGFSGPIFSMIPDEARGKSKNFETQEPTSPKVSCIGQIKHKKNLSKKKQASLPKEFRPEPEKITKTRSVGPASELKKKPSGIKKILSSRRKSDACVDQSKPPLPDRAPSLSQARRFASSRDTLANFDWTTTPVASVEDRDFYSDEDRHYSDGEDDAVFSAPILVTGAAAGVIGGLVLEPRKEINLWKRRTMAQPKPLQLNIVRAK